MTKTSLAKITAGLICATAVGAAPVWAAGRTIGPLVQASDLAPFPPDCGQFPGPGTLFPNSEVEPWVDVNPVDRDNIVAYWQQDRWSNGGARGLVAGVSLDGGATWEPVIVPGLSDCSDGPFERSSDPWVTFSPNGVLHAMSLVFDTNPDPNAPLPALRNGMAASKSEDGGLTWSDPILLIDESDPTVLNDKNSMTADPQDSNLAYAVWDRLQVFPDGSFEGPVFFTRTTDGGDSWEEATEIFDPGLVNQTIGNQIIVLPNGELLDFFNEIINVNPDGTVNPFPFNLAFIRSPDKGETWLTAEGSTRVALILALGVNTPDTGDPVRSAAIIFDVAVDPTRRRETVYAVWQDARFTGFDQVAFSQSTDGGLTWSNPIKVNQTPPNDDNRLRQQAFLPSVVAMPDGTVAVTYYDFRNDTAEGGELTDYFVVFCSIRCDQPENWRNEIRLTDQSFDYLNAPLTDSGLFLGDYVGLAATRRDFLPFFQQADPDPDNSANGFFRNVPRNAPGELAAASE